jgi:hypothetical protein
MGRNVSRDRVVAAKLTGVAAGVAHLHRCTPAEGLVEVAAILAEAKVRPGSDRAVELLSEAATIYVGPRLDPGSWWYGAALAFLAEAGADLDRAAALRAGRS